MLALVLPLFLQVAVVEPQAVQGPSAPTATESEQAKPAEPEVVCTMEPVTGSRARKQRVCRTKAYDKNGERMRDAIGMQERRGGATAAPGAPG
jgi:hypothetical protein